MHELSICQSMLRQIDTIVQEHQASRVTTNVTKKVTTKVTKVTLRIGPLSGVETRSLLRAFPLASAGTVADNATLVIESSPIRVHCRVCDQESEATINRLICSHCGASQTFLISGNEMLLAHLELNE